MFEFIRQVKQLHDKTARLRQEMKWILVGQAIAFVGGFVGIKVLTNVLGPEGYGQLALGLTIAGLFNLFIYGPVSNVVARFYSICLERGALAAYFAVLKRAHKVLALGLMLVAVVGGAVTWVAAGREWGLLVATAALFGVVGGVNASYIALQSAMRDRKVVALHQGLDAWVRIGLAVLLLGLFENSGYVALVGYLFGTLMVTISQSMCAYRNNIVKSLFEAEAVDSLSKQRYRKEFLEYATSFTIFSAFAAISMYADRWILQGMFGEKAVGIYSAIYQIAAAPVNIYFSMINQLMVPVIFSRAGAMTSMEQEVKSSRLTHATTVFSGAVTIIVVFISMCYAEPIVHLVTNSEYANYSQILWLSVVGLSIFNIGQLLSLKGIYHNKPKIYLWPKMLQAASFVLIACFMAQIFGIVGISYAVCLSSIIYCIFVVIANTRIKFMVQ